MFRNVLYGFLTESKTTRIIYSFNINMQEKDK